MKPQELLKIIDLGETNKVKFKEKMLHRDNFAQEIVAMSNAIGGMILIGIQDVTGLVIGLSSSEIESYDRQISYVADNIKPTVYITTEVVSVSKKNSTDDLLIIHVHEGINKPYKTRKGEIFVKQGANKRLLTDNAEIMRLFSA